MTVYKERGVDKIMEIFVWAGAKLLDDEEGSLRHWYSYIIVLMDAIVWCVVNA